MRWVPAAAVAGAALAGITFFLWTPEPKPDEVTPGSSAVRSQGKSPPAAQSSAATSGPAVIAAVRPSAIGKVAAKDASLSTALTSAPDLRKFALEARSQPQRGGYYFAMAAASMCGRNMQAVDEAVKRNVSTTVGRDTTISAEKLEELQKYSSRCASFAPGEADALYKAVRDQSKDSLDPLLNLRRAFTTAEYGTTSKLEAAAAIFRQGDAALISELQIPVRLAAANGNAPFSFSGVQYTSDEEKAVLLMALALGSCQSQQYCSMDDDMQLACATRGLCAHSREEYVRLNNFDPGATDAYKRAVALSEQVRQAIARGDVGAFVQRPSTGP